MDIRLIENQIPCGIRSDSSVIKTVIFHHLLYPKITEGDNKPVFKSLSQPVHHMKLLRFHASCQGSANPALSLKLSFYLIEFPQFHQRSRHYIHVSTPRQTFLLNSFIARSVSPASIISTAWRAFFVPSPIKELSSFEKRPST